MSKRLVLSLSVLMVSAVFISRAEARTNFTIKNGDGEEMTYKQGFFGKRQVVIKDRLGNKYEKVKGGIGSKKTEISVLGNHYTKKKGMFGSDEVEGRSILGDTVTTKKGLFGGKSTEIDVSGITGVVKGLMSDKGEHDPLNKKPVSSPLNYTDPQEGYLSSPGQQPPSYQSGL